MSLRSKWLDGVDAKHSVCDVAHRALQERLPVVLYYLPLAALHYQDDVEFVHQLRVSARRAAAVLQTFKPTLPKARRRRVYRRLAHIRRAAGPARELDVLVERFECQRKSINDTAGSPELSLCSEDQLMILIGLLAERRLQAQVKLRRAYKRQIQDDPETLIRDLIAATRWRGEGKSPTWGAAAPQLLKPSVRKAIQRSHLTDRPGDLHRFRIACKELRYGMELTSGLFDPSFRDSVYPFIREIQQQLGAINDHVSAAKLFQDILNAGKDDKQADVIHAALGRECQLVEALSDEFRHWWTDSRARMFRDELQARFKADQPPLSS